MAYAAGIEPLQIRFRTRRPLLRHRCEQIGKAAIDRPAPSPDRGTEPCRQCRLERRTRQACGARNTGDISSTLAEAADPACRGIPIIARKRAEAAADEAADP